MAMGPRTRPPLRPRSHCPAHAAETFPKPVKPIPRPQHDAFYAQPDIDTLEQALITPALRKGWVVTVPDYEGSQSLSGMYFAVATALARGYPEINVDLLMNERGKDVDAVVKGYCDAGVPVRYKRLFNEHILLAVTGFPGALKYIAADQNAKNLRPCGRRFCQQPHAGCAVHISLPAHPPVRPSLRHPRIRAGSCHQRPA